MGKLTGIRIGGIIIHKFFLSSSCRPYAYVLVRECAFVECQSTDDKGVDLQGHSN